MTKARTVSGSAPALGGSSEVMDPLNEVMDHTQLPPPPTYSVATSSNFDSLVRGVGPSPSLAADMAKVGRQMGRGKANRRRLVLKSGECNVTSKHVNKRHRSYLRDIFTTLVDMKWRYHVILFASGFLVSWVLFALIWYTIAVLHGDTHPDYNLNRTMCVEGVFNYHTALLFSIETQHTIGYGTRAVNDDCWHAVLILMLQSCVGTFVQALITGLIFAKISRPKGRAQTLLFSEKAVICKRDNEYFLLFRVGDMRRSHMIGTSIRAMLVKNRLTAEGESIPLCQYHLALESETSRSDCLAFLVWPVTVVHKIDSNSPLWELSAAGLYQDHFEIIVILEGTIESTGSLTQVRTSYIPTEIRWGERLAPLVTYQRFNGKYDIDYEQFHATIPMTNMQTCSARENYEAALVAAGVSGQLPHDDKDFPYSFTAPAVRDGTVTRKHTMPHLFAKKTKHSSHQHETQSEMPSEYITINGVTRRNEDFGSIQRKKIGEDNSASDSITSAATISNPMLASRRPGSKRPLWFDKQSLKQLAGRREGSFRGSHRLYPSGRSREPISTFGHEIDHERKKEEVKLVEDSGLNTLKKSVPDVGSEYLITGSSAGRSSKADVPTIVINSPDVELYTVDEHALERNNSHPIISEINNNGNTRPGSSNIAQKNDSRNSTSNIMGFESRNVDLIELNNGKSSVQELGKDSKDAAAPAENIIRSMDLLADDKIMINDDYTPIPKRNNSESNISVLTKPDSSGRRNSRFKVTLTPLSLQASKATPIDDDNEDNEACPSSKLLESLSIESKRIPV